MAGSSSGGGGGGGGGVPPGFRFHPTDEELLHFYLKKKVSFQKFEMDVIREVDLNKIEPWELAERCKIGSTPQNEWYFFSHKDRKYPTGSRTNRATHAGFWKATGRDKCIRNTFKKIGMRKTLVFYRGRAPHGQKTDWIMHEYRLEDSDHHHHDNVNEPPPPPNEDGWVVCRVFKKKNLFKIGSSSSSGNAAQGETGSVLMPNTNNYNNNQYDLLQHQHQHQHQHQPAADLNYSHIPLHYPQLESHAFNHLKPPLMLTNYDHHPIPTTAAPDYDPPMMQVKQFMSSNTTTTRDDHSCECDQSSSQPAMLQLRDDHQWDPLSNPHHQDSNINQINLRSEMDFWAYGK